MFDLRIHKSGSAFFFFLNSIYKTLSGTCSSDMETSGNHELSVILNNAEYRFGLGLGRIPDNPACPTKHCRIIQQYLAGYPAELIRHCLPLSGQTLVGRVTIHHSTPRNTLRSLRSIIFGQRKLLPGALMKNVDTLSLIMTTNYRTRYNVCTLRHSVVTYANLCKLKIKKTLKTQIDSTFLFCISFANNLMNLDCAIFFGRLS